MAPAWIAKCRKHRNVVEESVRPRIRKGKTTRGLEFAAKQTMLRFALLLSLIQAHVIIVFAAVDAIDNESFTKIHIDCEFGCSSARPIDNQLERWNGGALVPGTNDIVCAPGDNKNVS